MARALAAVMLALITPTPLWAQDVDGDGYTAEDGDCDDYNPTVFPGATELCDGLDNDCDGSTGSGEEDDDGDGEMPCQGDCDDTDPTIAAAADEACDGIDNDCDGLLLEGEYDTDGDGWLGCGEPPNDCDDGNPGVNPAQVEVCDGVDTDCDGALLPDEVDDDGDGYPTCDGEVMPADCDDGDAAVHGGAREACDDGIDNDCDGEIDEYCYEDGWDQDNSNADAYGCAVRLGDSAASAAILVPVLLTLPLRRRNRGATRTRL